MGDQKHRAAFILCPIDHPSHDGRSILALEVTELPMWVYDQHGDDVGKVTAIDFTSRDGITLVVGRGHLFTSEAIEAARSGELYTEIEMVTVKDGIEARPLTDDEFEIRMWGRLARIVVGDNPAWPECRVALEGT